MAGMIALGLGLAAQAELTGPSSRRTAWVISEIMVHPPSRPDGKNLEFIEIQNCGLIEEELGGYRISGAWDYTFPDGLLVPAGGYAVLAAEPAEVESVYGINGVLGGMTNGLPNDRGTLRLRNPAGAILLEVRYGDTPPWPASTDGGGHSLVLSRPSYGEGDPQAWGASSFVGGSPGQRDPGVPSSMPVTLINEILAHTDDPQLDFIEIFNPTALPQDLSGCRLTDHPEREGYRIAPGTVLGSRQALAFDQTQLGFALSAAGEKLFLFAADDSRVLDALHFGPQANGVAFGRSPDGAATWSELAMPSPGLPNAEPRQGEVVINEIFYHPPSGEADDEYVELHSLSPEPVDLSGWRFVDGVDFTFPEGAVLEPNSFLVVGRSVSRLQTNYPGLPVEKLLGNYQGSLANDGERLALSRPEFLVATNLDLTLSTNVVYVLVDEVTYRDGGRWGRWADGGGSSLELRDPRADNRLADAWADSDESLKSEWTEIEFTGTMDHGVGAIDAVQVLLQGAGACLLDDLEVVGAGGQNSVPQGTFGSGTEGWSFEGTHDGSRWQPSEGFGAIGALRVEAVARGDTGANRISSTLSPQLTVGETATIRAKARWLFGNPELIIRLRGNYLDAFGRMQLPKNLGTPGLPNGQRLDNAGPLITQLSHTPVLPSAGQPVRVTARVEDPDGVGEVTLRYRLDPSSAYLVMRMVDDGTGGDEFPRDGFFTAVIPGQTDGSLVAFQIAAEDASAAAAPTVFPDAPPFTEALVRFGEIIPRRTSLPVYRLWMTEATFGRWSERSPLDNTPLPVTFVYDNDRVVHGVGALYAGSPHIAPGYDNPSGRLCGYVLLFPEDNRFLGATDVVLDWPGRDATAQQEPMAYWLARELGIPFNHRRYIRLHVNGRTETERGSIYEDAQQVNRDLIESWVPDQTDGNLYKIEQWFEFRDDGSRYHTGPPRLENYTTTGGAKKTARYRWCWLPRAVRTSANDFASLFTLVDAANASREETYIRQMETLIDVEQWMRTFAVENIIVNFDAWGYDIGKNIYAYKPTEGPWQLFMWDIDWVMLASAQHNYSPTSPLMYTGTSKFGEGNRDPVVGRMYRHPALQRAYWRAMHDAVNGPLLPERVAARMDPMHLALSAAGVTRSAGQVHVAPTEVKDWLQQRRSYLLEELATVDSVFSVTSASTGIANTATLQGTAPITVAQVQVNGRNYPVTWTTVTSWEIRIPLETGVNDLWVTGIDPKGAPVPGASLQTELLYELPLAAPREALVINEIQYHPALSGAAFVEIFNRSTSTAFDLSGWRLRGADFRFPSGTWIGPGEYLVAANNRERLAQAYGIDTLAVGDFSGQLRNDGETLALAMPDLQGSLGATVDQVTYDDEWPWPAVADGYGPSLQLIDPSQDNRRPGNWTVVQAGATNASQRLIEIGQVWRYHDEGQDLGITWREPDYDDSLWPQGGALLYHETSALPAPKATPITHGAVTYYFRTPFEFDGDPASVALHLTTVIDDGAVFYLNGQEWFRLGVEDGLAVDYQTLASRIVGDAAQEGPFMLPPTLLQLGSNVLAVEVHQGSVGSSDVVFGLSLETAPETQLASATPGRANAVDQTLASLPNLWINEFQASNQGGYGDRFGDPDPWVELFNAGSTPIPLDTVALSDSAEDLLRWTFPAGASLDEGQRVLVWLDGEPEESDAKEFHANFRVAPDQGVLVLTAQTDGPPRVLDSIRYAALAPGTTFVLMPDGNADDRRLLTSSTPGGANAWPPLPHGVLFNEWMAANQGAILDPVDNDADDWFELYNATDVEIDLSGALLSDDPMNPAKFTIPTGTLLPAQGYLLCWADEELSQTAAGFGLHVNFKLALSGEALLLHGADGTLIDAVTFGAQQPDLSEGRWPDGETTQGVLSVPTPGASNMPYAGPVEGPYLLGLQIDDTGTTYTLTWTSSPGVVYRVQSSTTLQSTDWQDVSGDLSTEEATIVFDGVPLAGDGQQYWRVVVPE